MEFTIKPAELAKKLQLLRPFTSDIMPNLEGFLFKDNMIHASDVSIFASIQCDGIPKQFVSPGKLMIQVLKSIQHEPEATVNIDGLITITTPSAEFTLPLGNVDDWPEIQQPGGDAKDCDCGVLKHIIENTLWAVPTRDPRQVLMGVNFSNGYACATDGRLLSRARVEQEFPPAIIPSKTLAALLPFLDLSETVYVSSSGPRVCFDGGTWALSTGTIEGTFPNFNAIIPKAFSCHATVDVAQFKSVVTQAAIMSDDKHHIINLSIRDGRVDIKSNSIDRGQYSGFFGAQFDNGSIDIAFNSEYLERMLSVITTDKITINIKDAVSPVTVTIPDDPHLLFLVMPVRKNELSKPDNGD